MKLSSVINKDLIFTDLKATSIEGVIDEMVTSFFDVMDIDEALKDDFVTGIMDRENQASTAFGKGVAFPHARIDKFNDFAIIIGIQKEGIEHKALDNKPVKLFFMIVAAKTKNTQLLRSLASLSELISIEGVIAKILESNAGNIVYDIINEAGIDFKKSITAKDIMITNPYSLSPDMTMKEASDFLFNKNVAGLPVLEDGKVVGELTEKELIKVGLPESMSLLSSVSFIKDFEAFEKFFKEEDKIKVGDICNREILTVSPDTSIVEVSFLFVNKSRRRLYVTDKEKNLIGVVNRHDVLMKILHP